jgi:hypothetical protein
MADGQWTSCGFVAVAVGGIAGGQWSGFDIR